MDYDETWSRYFLIEEQDGSCSIADQHITQAEPGHRMISGLCHAQAEYLLLKLNSMPSQSVPERPCGMNPA